MSFGLRSRKDLLENFSVTLKFHSNGEFTRHTKVHSRITLPVHKYINRSYDRGISFIIENEHFRIERHKQLQKKLRRKN